jgi:hypothetical protein
MINALMINALTRARKPGPLLAAALFAMAAPALAQAPSQAQRDEPVARSSFASRLCVQGPWW